MRLQDTTEYPSEEEVNVNGTVYGTPHTTPDDDVLKYIKEYYKKALEQFPELEAIILDRGPEEGGTDWVDCCLEYPDGKDMKEVILWWKKQ